MRQKRFRHADGHYVWVEVSVAIMDQPGAEARELMMHVRDITEHLDYERQLRHLAEHDHLTGLLNRRAFEQRFQEFVNGDEGTHGAFLMIDLDNFKHHYDTYGHAVGDAILVGIAWCLEESVPADAVVGRLGGDEFAVLLPGSEAPEELARKLLEEIAGAAAAISPDAELPVTASIGVAAFAGSVDLDTVMLRADDALYAAKGSGRNRVSAAPR